MTNNLISSTGNDIVDAISKINITGNIIPEAWYKTIQKTRKHPYLHAIILLSEIVYWYRPKEVCDEATGDRTYKKKFTADLWQVSMSTLSDKFGLSKDQVRTALDFLEADIQVIKRHYRTIDSRTGKLSNVMYIELIPDVLMNLTYPETNSADNENIPDGSEISSNTYLEKSEEVLEISPDPIRENSNTYTENTLKNTEENNTKTTTTEEAVVCCCNDSLSLYVKDKFSNYNLADKDLEIITTAAKEGTKDIDRAYEYLINYNKPIKNIVPFIVATIKNGWCVDQISVLDNTKSHKDMHGFKGRDYDYNALEKLLFNKF